MSRDTQATPPGYPPIGAYGIVGNCRAAALISERGSVDWLCWPRFDSPSTFGALLDRERGGRFHLCPVGPFKTSRRYLPDTNVLETTFETAGGALRLIDLMPVATEEEKRRHLWPDHQLLRVLDCLSGEVEVQLTFEPRPGYGAVRPKLRAHGALGLFYEDGGAALTLESDLPIEAARDRSGAHARARLHAGERRYAALSYSEHIPAILSPPGGEAEASIRRTCAWWRQWLSRCSYHGPWADQVRRSAL
ncbi:MAG TPA: trehalase-like domain-containing protein, partial [Longimicrobiales bacterium]